MNKKIELKIKNPKIFEKIESTESIESIESIVKETITSTPRKSLGVQNKRKGSNAERLYAKIFREVFGFKFCKTSRFASRVHDDAGIDLMYLPFNVQIKAGKQKGLNPIKELKNMENKIKELFPPNSPESKLPKIVLHKKERLVRNKPCEFEEIVTMSFEDFGKIITKVEKWD